MYSHGGCFDPGKFPPGTTIGRYCSIAKSVVVMNVNHPMNLKSSHAFFFNPGIGYSKIDLAEYSPLVIGNDVWIGYNALILPSCSHIGDGAIIGAGAIVHKNIPPYAVVVGNPCRVVRFRFSKEIIDDLLASRWWEKSIEELADDLPSFQRPLEGDRIR